MMTRLATVQRAKRVGAEAALARARSEEEDALAAEEDMRAKLTDAHKQWLDHLAEPRFAPEFSVLLSNAVIGRADDVDGTVRDTATAAEASLRAQSEWQLLEARVRHGDASLHSFRRKVARRFEEKRTAERADRTTYDWSSS